MRHAAVLTLLLVVALATARPAAALTIDQSESFSGQIDSLGVTPFDPALGTLDRVRVNISGVLTVGGVTGLNQAPPGPFGSQVPQPYSFAVDVQQRFFGLGGRYFEFSGPGAFHFGGQASGAGEAFQFVAPFTYDFEFNAITDLIGFTLPSTSGVIPPPGGIIGTRARFIDNGIPLNEIDLVQQATVSGQLATTTPTSISFLSAAGQLQIHYDVPEPSSLALLGVALVIGAGHVITARRRQ